MPGEKPFGFHEGSRSEYLAQYAFASWGTAVVIPQQEDHGLDLHCTLMEKVGRRFLAKCPYTVQVKSELKPVLFEGKEAVRWVIEHPLPLFLCIVDKASARLSVYHTLVRFHAWSLGQWPDRLAMIPDSVIPSKEGKCISWPGSYELSLDQPILDFSVNEMLDEVFWQKAREVFEHWIEVENDNLTRVRTRLLSCRVPDQYKTNEKWMTGWVTISLRFPNKEQVEQTTARLMEPVEWVGEQLLRNGDLAGAAKAALLHRHLFPEAHGGLFYQVQHELNSRLGRNNYVYAGVDHLAEVIQKTLKGNGKGPA
jgi:hypothetical protein